MALKYHKVTTLDELNKSCERILDSGVTLIGLDTESTITGKTRSSIDLIQISIIGDHGGESLDSTIDSVKESAPVTTVFLFDMTKIKVQYAPKPLEKLMMDRRIKKIGCALFQDTMLLRNCYGTKTMGAIDLQEVAESIGIVGISLDDLSKRLLGTNKVQLDLMKVDWAAEWTPEMLKYAVFDAALAIHCYLALFKPVPPAPLPSDDEVEAVKLLAFLEASSLFKGKGTSTMKLIHNTIRNGYGAWRTIYKPDQIQHLTAKYLGKLIEMKKVHHNVDTGEFSLQELVTTVPRVKVEIKPNNERTKKLLRQLSLSPEGIARSSFLKFIINSYTTNIVKPEEKEASALAIMNELIASQSVTVHDERLKAVV